MAFCPTKCVSCDVQEAVLDIGGKMNERQIKEVHCKQ